MDRFLFRAYDKVHRDVKDVAMIDWVEEVVLLWNRSGSVGVTVARDFDQVELMQYTGLRDKNGVKIFEGEIFVSYKGWGDQRHVVNYNADFLGFGSKIISPLDKRNHQAFPLTSQITYNDNYGIQSMHIEVIGNKWCNPELLEVE